MTGWPCLFPFPSIPAIQKEAKRTSLPCSSAATVCQIYITNVPSLAVELFLAAMQRPFAKLTDLILFSSDETVPVDPDSFLGRYAPRISFPGLPKLFLSASHIYLRNILHSGYISPEAMAAALSTLTSLKSLTLEFLSLDFSLTGQADVCFPQHALSSPFSQSFGSRGSANIWRTSWPASIPPNSTPWI